MKLSYASYILLTALTICSVACEKNKETSAGPDATIQPLTDAQSGSFLPMHIGNYWKLGTASFIEITDTLRFNNKLYYKFYSMIGGDAFSTRYLRIDENNQLLEGYPGQAGKEYLHAKFSADLNDVFYTLNDQTWNDYMVKMVTKNDTVRAFEFDMVYHPNMKGVISKRTFIRGYGWGDDKWDSVRINGVVFRK